MIDLFKELENIHSRPKAFEFYTASDLWTDEHTSEQMLKYHLNRDVDISSRNHAFIDASVDWICSHFNVGIGFKIADFGCGPGLYSVRLAEKGAEVTGIDFSRRSIEYAKNIAAEKSLSINYINQNYLDFEANEQFDLIIMIMCDFCALSPDQRKILLNIFHNTLKPGGTVLLDVYSLTAFEQREETVICEENLQNGFWSSEKYFGFMKTFKYDDEKVVLDKYTIVESNRIRTIYNWLQYFNPENLKNEFLQCGFEIERFYSDVAGTSYNTQSSEFAVVARRQ